MNDDMDERYATAREHWELREDVAGLKADMRQIGPQLTRIETMIAAKPAQPAGPDNSALPLHHAAAAMTEAAKALQQRPNVAAEVLHALNTSKAGRSGSGPLWALCGALAAMVALLGWRSFTGG